MPCYKTITVKALINQQSPNVPCLGSFELALILSFKIKSPINLISLSLSQYSSGSNHTISLGSGYPTQINP